MTATKTNKIDEITEQLEQGVKNVFESAEYKAYLEFVSKFYDYSINNVFLIFMQMPTATHVAGFKAWPNAITKLARSNNNSDGATIYITASPCIECAKLIIQAGIKRVVYGEKYRLTDGIELLERAGIEVIYIGLEDK